MSDLLSPKVVFYLEHHERIQEWADLRSKMNQEVHQWLSSWAEEMHDEERFQDRRFFRRLLDPRYAKLFWYRDGWVANRAEPDPGASPDEDGGDEIHAGIGFEWRPNRPAGRRELWLGVWINRRAGPKDNLDLQRRLEDLLRSRSGGRCSNWWPWYEYLEPIQDAVTRELPANAATGQDDAVQRALAGYRDKALTGADELWKEFADIVDEALSNRADGA